MANSKELPLHALVTSPKLIVADEPTGSLDTETAPWILHTLVNVNPQGATNVLATHDFGRRKACVSNCR